MLKCWQEDPEDRPTFEDLTVELKAMENQYQVLKQALGRGGGGETKSGWSGWKERGRVIAPYPFRPPPPRLRLT